MLHQLKVAMQPRFRACLRTFCGIALGVAIGLNAGCHSSEPVAVVGSTAGQAATVAGSGVGAGSVSTAGVAASPAPPVVAPPAPCGETLCSAPKNVAADLLRGVTGLSMTGAETVGCCLDLTSSTCSSAPAAGGATCDELAVPEPRCPGVDLSALVALVGGLGPNAQTMLGCCTHGMCGQDGELFGRGCVENGEAKRMLGGIPVVGPLIKVPAPMVCPAAMSGNDADAGI